MSTIDMTSRPFIITGRKVLLGMIGFFGVIFAVNGVFLYFAMKSWPGLTTDKAYVEGIEYNQVLEAAEQQQALGWISAIEYRTVDGHGVIRVLLSDRDLQPIDGAEPYITLTRPVGSDTSMTVSAIAVEPGIYDAILPALNDGRWRVTVRVDEIYTLHHDLWLTP